MPKSQKHIAQQAKELKERVHNVLKLKEKASEHATRLELWRQGIFPKEFASFLLKVELPEQIECIITPAVHRYEVCMEGLTINQAKEKIYQQYVMWNQATDH